MLFSYLAPISSPFIWQQDLNFPVDATPSPVFALVTQVELAPLREL